MLLVSTLFFISCLFTDVVLVSGAGGKVSVIPREDETVLYSNKFRVSMNEMFDIESDIPVALLRYTDENFWAGNEVIDQDEMYVFVKTNCPQIYNEVEITPTRRLREVIGLNIRGNPNNDGLKFSQRSNLNTTWYYTSFWCQAQANRGGTRHLEDELKGMHVFEDFDVEGTQEPEEGECGAVVEILYDGCERPVIVNSPRMKVSDVVLRNIEMFDTDDECTKFYEARTRPTKTFSRSGEPPFEVKNLVGKVCGRQIEGRPFIDSSGQLLQADAVQSNEACWASNEKSFVPKIDITASQNEKYTEKLKSAWINRGLGEHSSIASFAAATIALMTNNAPPELIRDSLKAALDEVNHATTSFNVASMLSDEIIEPGPLPPSSHYFNTNIYVLLKNTFEEGCIDETISAVVAAAEADFYANSSDEMEKNVLAQELGRIALDEARHAALAFRTVHWGCGMENLWCQDNIADYFLKHSLWEHAGNRFSLSHAGEVLTKLEYLYDALLKSVSGASEESAEVSCVKLFSNLSSKNEESVVNKVIGSIAQQVLCAPYFDFESGIAEE